MGHWRFANSFLKDMENRFKFTPLFFCFLSTRFSFFFSLASRACRPPGRVSGSRPRSRVLTGLAADILSFNACQGIHYIWKTVEIVVSAANTSLQSIGSLLPFCRDISAAHLSDCLNWLRRGAVQFLQTCRSRWPVIKPRADAVMFSDKRVQHRRRQTAIVSRSHV
jgi:hypothetical protein